MRRRRLLTLTLGLAALAALAPAAGAAVKSSTYALVAISQTSSVVATNGTATYQAKATFVYTAKPGKARLRIDFPAKGGNADGFIAGGTNPRYGVLQGVFAQQATQSGTVTHEDRSCQFRSGEVPKEERELNVTFRRTSAGNPRFVYPVVLGPNALERLYEEIGFFDRNQCNVRRDLVPVRPASPSGFETEVSFPVKRSKLRLAFAGKPRTIVLRGTTTTPIDVVPNRAGELTVTTRITLRLVASS
ncbi:MAG: hypothetical protein R3C15_13145 [Thermoleophilia bacterium]